MAEEKKGRLSPGTIVKTTKGEKVKVIKYIANGGQGEVYKVDLNGEPKAMKWYYPNKLGTEPKKFYANIEANINRGAPDKVFLWPQRITEWKDGTFGYLMELKPDSFYEMKYFFLNTPRFDSTIRKVDAALKIVSAYRILHNAGYSYFDLNDGNFFINPNTGDVLIADCDNVAPDGTDVGGILGKPAYMAPEVTTGASIPNSASDRYSMAILIYMLFLNNHPLQGKRFVEAALTDKEANKIYGTEATFMMDPAHPENGPIRGIHNNSINGWPELPDHFKSMFERTFCERGNKTPGARPKEIEWLKSLTRLRSEIVECSCGWTTFLNDQHLKCDGCKKNFGIKHVIALHGHNLYVRKGLRIYRCELGACNETKALDPVAMIVSKGNDSTKLGLKNMSADRWDAFTPTGTHRVVNKGEVIPIIPGIKVEIGSAKMEIRSI